MRVWRAWLLALTAVSAARGAALEFCDDLWGCPEGKNPYAERIETERHDFTQSATTVGHGVVQVEAGLHVFL